VRDETGRREGDGQPAVRRQPAGAQDRQARPQAEGEHGRADPQLIGQLDRVVCTHARSAGYLNALPGWVPEMKASWMLPGVLGSTCAPVLLSTLRKMMFPGEGNSGFCWRSPM